MSVAASADRSCCTCFLLHSFHSIPTVTVVGIVKISPSALSAFFFIRSICTLVSSLLILSLIHFAALSSTSITIAIPSPSRTTSPHQQQQRRDVWESKQLCIHGFFSHVFVLPSLPPFSHVGFLSTFLHATANTVSPDGSHHCRARPSTITQFCCDHPSSPRRQPPRGVLRRVDRISQHRCITEGG